MIRISAIIFAGFVAANAVVCSASATEGSVKSELTIERYNSLTTIFIGKVVSMQPVDHGYGILITFQPTTVFKGEKAGQIVVHTYSQRTNGCGLHAALHEKWLIFAEEDGVRLTTSYCAGSTAKTTDAQLLEQIRSFSERGDGYMEWSYSNGKTGGKGDLVNGKPHGKWEYYYPDGYLKSEGSYMDGRKDSTWLYYSEAKYLYKMTNGLEVLKNIMDSLWLSPTAAKHMVEKADYYIESVLDSGGDQWSKEGDLKKIENYKIGLLNGETITYHDNGQTEKEENYLSGKLHGKFASYYANGQVNREGFYANGRPKGKWIDYNKNGSVRHEAVDSIPAYRATKDGMVPVTGEEKKTAGGASLN